ncbi:MAG: hypothetical protein PF693_00590 [Spirochaetia bacterium]|nr:hypothetical protein [Spirochaetia bacterium]
MKKNNRDFSRTKLLAVIMVIILMSIPGLCSAGESTSPQSADKLFLYSHSKAMEALSFSMDTLEINYPLSSLHKGLGYATVAMGMLTGILNPENVGENLHQTLGYTTAGFAFATMAAGFIAHYRDIDLQSGWSSNNIHTILGITGGVMMMIAPFLAPGDAHQVLGELGALTMGISIVGKLVY